ncbi:MAG: polysaccharide biosynthesis tyrosine autokinase [Cytophagales bacterium]|nr:polysaccharide biosynthesis tyrosine autokinase [Cytophagales bacterium]
MYEIYRDIYSFLLQKKADAGINRASNVPDIKVIDYAAVSGPPTPDFEKIQSIALLLALGIPIGFIFLKDYFNTKIIFKDDIFKFSSIPFLGVIGHNSKDTLAVIERPKSSLAESFRSVRSNILFLNPDKKNQIFLLTSTTSGEGKSFCSMNIAAVMAISGKNTILIGADMRKPKLYEELKLKNEVGLSNYLSGSANLDEVIQKTSVEHMDFISSGIIPPNPAELIMGQRMEQIIEELRKRYDYIVIDTPPIGLVIDAFVLMKYSDTNIYVVRHNYSKRQGLLEINEKYRDGKFSNLNIILNDVKSNGIYGYGYGYGNTSYGYGYYSDTPASDSNQLSGLMDKLKSLIGIKA